MNTFGTEVIVRLPEWVQILNKHKQVLKKH